jgi:Response regulator containing a CheY-like receiver domain and an HTH DNA-binding domain
MESKKKYKLTIVEPSVIITQGLKALFAPHPEFEIINCYSDFSHFLERINSSKTNIILMNPSLIDYQKRMNIKSHFSSLPDVILFAIEYNYIESEVLKQYNGTIEITDDIATIVRKLKQAIENNQENSENGDNYELSDREIEILTSVARGLTNKEIADLHNISIHTVISHRKNITRKTGIKTVSGLTVYAMLNNLIDQSDIE